MFIATTIPFEFVKARRGEDRFYFQSKRVQWKPLNTPPVNTPKPLITPTRPGPEFLLNTECIKLPLNAPKVWQKAAYYAQFLPKIRTFSMNFLPKSSKTGNFQKRFIENLSHNFKVALLSIEYQKSVLLHFTKILILMNSAFYENFIREKWTSLITPKPLITPSGLGPEVGVITEFYCTVQHKCTQALEMLL